MLSNLNAVPHVVRSGDNLSSIAQKHGYRDWKVIYESKCNQPLRLLRPNPNFIKPGDTVMLPPKARDVRLALEERLQKLTVLRVDTESSFRRVEKELDSAFATLERTAKNADVAAEVLLLLNSLTSMCWKGYKSLQLGGEALEKANKELAKEALDLAYDKPKQLVLETYAGQLDKPQPVQLSESMLWVFSATVIKAWLDINSPSFWAQVISELQQGSSWSTAVTRKPEEIHKETRKRIQTTRDDALRNLDARIAETRRQLVIFTGVVGVPLPLK